jgi:parallel beta-helix repeat protein
VFSTIPFSFSLSLRWVAVGFIGYVLASGELPSAQAAHINCGDKLGPGGIYVLDADLICSNSDPEEFYARILTIVGGASVDLNGHTLSCGPGLRFGLVIEGAANQLRNGSIVGCPEGILLSNEGSRLENITLSNNGVALHAEAGGRHLLIHNHADNNGAAFWLSDGSGFNTLIGNTASHNTQTAFYLDGGKGNTLVGNTAVSNRFGFSVSFQEETKVVGNTAHANTEGGFGINSSSGRGSGGAKLSGNIATGNGAYGFHISESQRVQAVDNLAQGNDGHGFVVSRSDTRFRDHHELKNNYALDNNGDGIRVELGATGNEIIGNTTVGHLTPNVDLRDENTDCRGNRWKNNIFDTKSQDCIQ